MNSVINKSYQEFWKTQATCIPWFVPFSETLLWKKPFAHWFAGGELNASFACLDQHIEAGRGNHMAIRWCNEKGNRRDITYQELHDEVNRFTHVLKGIGVKTGDIVVIYMPMIPEAIMAMLACARLGATYSVVFSGFSSTALRDRLNDTNASFIITADHGIRRGKTLNIKAIVDEALEHYRAVKNVLVIQRGESSPVLQTHDILYHLARPQDTVYVKPVSVEANHPLFILYTSGTTGKPKGLMHSTGGYLVYAYSTFAWAFNPDKNSVYWCTADIGWITGHSYVTYAPLMHGVTMVLYEGAPDYPDAGIWWKLIQDYKVSIFYTSPTALRMAIAAGNEWPLNYDLTSLKTLGSVGEPINPEVWKWYSTVIGGSQCPVIDTWWQTETGGFMIAPTAGLTLLPLKPGSATKPLPCIDAEILDSNGLPVMPNTKGHLVIKHPWPGMSIGIYKCPERFEEVYWSKFPDFYYTGDYAMQDADGYFWLLGRADEVLNVAGHRVGTAEIESAAVAHHAVAEAAAIGIADSLRGEAVVLFVTLKQGISSSEELSQAIIQKVRLTIGAFITPRSVFYVGKLPKTRSGKIMRRVLKGIIEGKSLGDITTIEEEASLEEIKAHYFSMQSEISPV
jgi:acetyl-CoA synthetase